MANLLARVRGAFENSFPTLFIDIYDEPKAKSFGERICFMIARKRGAFSPGENRYVVLKLLRKLSTNHQYAVHALREIKYLSRMEQDNVMTLNRVGGNAEQQYSDVFIEMRVTGGDVKSLLAKECLFHNSLPRMQCMQNILAGLAYMHSAQLVHRCLNPEHILYCYPTIFKITGFSHVRKVGGAEDTLSKSFPPSQYHAPEMILHPTRYTSAIDIYSAGLIMIEIEGLRHPFIPESSGTKYIQELFSRTGRPRNDDLVDYRDDEEKQWIRNLAPSIPHRTWAEIFPHYPLNATNLLEGMLEFASSRRITAAAALNFQYAVEGRPPNWEPRSYQGPALEDIPSTLSLPAVLHQIQQSITLDIPTPSEDAQ